MSYPELFTDIGHWDRQEQAFVGDLKAARQVADGPWYRHLSYRDGGKRIGHGSNYWGTPYGIASAIGIPPGIVTNFQHRYFGAFPEIPRWHKHTIGEVQQTQRLTTPFGNTRLFFDRASDDSTLREAIAHVPQSTIGIMLNEGLRRVWEYGIRNPSFPVQLLLQVHDSITFQYPDRPAKEAAILAKIKQLLTVPIPIHRRDPAGNILETRTLTIPLEFKTGWNWAKADSLPKGYSWPVPPEVAKKNHILFPSDGNPDGLRKYNPAKPDDRRRVQPQRSNPIDWLG